MIGHIGDLEQVLVSIIGQLSRKAKQSRDRLIARAESRAVQQHGYGAVAG